jgi:APA family basic amino acid/polyamine antiporter
MSELKKELNTISAVLMGLGSIVGTGVFVSTAIAADVAGPAVILAAIIAALTAFLNALSSAQLASNYPISGGTYEYGYRTINQWFGFSAGAMFICAKSASAATAALGFSGYFLNFFGIEAPLIRTSLAIIITIILTIIIISGIKRSNIVNTIIVSTALLTLAIFIIIGLFNIDFTNFQPFINPGPERESSSPLSSLLFASALMFVAYTGYGRIATLGEEVKDPKKTIPKAIISALGFSAVLYILVSIVAIGTNGSHFFASSIGKGGAPLEYVAATFQFSWIQYIVGIGALFAMTGVLLNLILGLSRVYLAMGRRGDLPKKVSIINKNGSPTTAIVLTSIVIIILVSSGDIKLTWSFSAFTVLIYYSITNLSAIRLQKNQRLYPEIISYAGLGACLFLAFWIEFPVLLAGSAILAVTLIFKFLLNRKPLEVE